MTRKTQGHCPTCRCPEDHGPHLIVYPPNAVLYGTCPECGWARWQTETWTWTPADGWVPERAQHCHCCTHEHLPPGGHDLTTSAPGQEDQR